MPKRKAKVPVYSYLRFSTPEQQKGDSERRQTEPAVQWINRPDNQAKGYYLETQLADRGLSGYHGHHRTKGALGRFLKAVEDNKVPRGSILLVENIDRLSREGAVNTLREVIFKLWDHGITLQTLGPEETFEPGCDGNPKFIALTFSIQHAKAESQRKSDMIRASRETAVKKARETGKIVTGKCPEWLEVLDGKFCTKAGAAETIRVIFEWKLQGLSQRKIEARLNAEAPWSPPPKKKEDRDARRPGNGWRTSYIKKILGNRAVIGEYQPYHKVNGKREPYDFIVEGYYPPIVKSEVFYAVRHQLAANKGKGGRTGKKRNIFTHIAKCGYCGGPMRFTDKGKKDWQYLVCDNAARGLSCECHTVKYAEAQTLILKGCRHLKPAQVLPNPDEQTAKVKVLSQSINGGKAELRDIEEQRQNFVQQIGRTKQPKIRDEYEAQVIKLDERIESVKASLERNRHALAGAKSNSEQFENWQTGLAELMNAIADEEAVNIRLRLAVLLRDYIARIEVFPVGFKAVADPDTDFITERGEVGPGRDGRKRWQPAKRGWKPNVDTIIETMAGFWDFVQPKSTKMKRTEFERYVLARRMSKDGRFYRIRFKNGEWCDIVPPDGLATGWQVMKSWVKKVSPDLVSLWSEFRGKSIQQGRRRT